MIAIKKVMLGLAVSFLSLGVISCNDDGSLNEEIKEINFLREGGMLGLIDSIVITKDSIHYSHTIFDPQTRKMIEKKYEAETPAALWAEWLQVLNLNTFRKIKSGESIKPMDGSDETYSVVTDKRTLSFVNGYGTAFEKLNKLWELIGEQRSKCYEAAEPTDPGTDILMLKIDYTTHRFEGGTELAFSKSAETFTVTNELVQPVDFGSIKLFYSEINELLFYGTIVWMGCGEILYPENWLPAEDFERTNDALISPVNGFEDVLNPDNQTCNYEQVWGYVQHAVKARDYLQANPSQTVKILFYQPSVGVGDPADWKWIVILTK
jgi:hypothetical protein